MKAALETPLRQRADYTHKYNLTSGRHGWLRLTPAYSVRIVEEIINHTTGHRRVFDPFCGTGTTALSAAYHGHYAATTEINPFLVWLAQAKTDHYSIAVVTRTRSLCREILETVRTGKIQPVSRPPLHNIERWWPIPALDFLCSLQAAVEKAIAPESQESTLLKLAFCRTLIQLSNAAFNHQSMSFKDADHPQLALVTDHCQTFAHDLEFILNGAIANPEGDATIIHHDARTLSQMEVEPFDLVITSPPYANRMSYIRELRPYMYWLRFLLTAREAGELDWQAIGGTWGIATSRLNEWTPPDGSYQSDHLDTTLSRIASPENANGQLLSTYVHKYCVDMAEHFHGLRNLLNPGARLHYIVGNSTFYGVLLPVEAYYADMLTRLGFSDVSIRSIRKRNSKKELVEFDVSARWQP